MIKVKGFTLIEMVVTVIVLTVLVVIAMPRYYEITEKGRGAEAREILLKAYGGYQRRVVDEDSVAWGNISNNWAGLGMSNPNASASAYFNYNFDNTSGYRLVATRKTNAARNMTIFLGNGTLVKTFPY